MHPDAPYFSILLCLMLDGFTCHVESAATQWVNQTNFPCILLTLWVAMHPDVPYFSILLCLTPDKFTRHVESAATQWVNTYLVTFVPLTVSCCAPAPRFLAFV